MNKGCRWKNNIIIKHVFWKKKIGLCRRHICIKRLAISRTCRWQTVIVGIKELLMQNICCWHRRTSDATLLHWRIHLLSTCFASVSISPIWLLSSTVSIYADASFFVRRRMLSVGIRIADAFLELGRWFLALAKGLIFTVNR